MKRFSAWCCALVLTLASCACVAQQPPQPKVRQAGVAGAFYPADPAALTAMIDGFLAKAETPKIDGQIFAVVSPHAGYQYSGPVAAYTYAALKGRKFKRVVVIAPSHYEAFSYSSVYDGDAYDTPLGMVKVDKEFARKLVSMDRSIQFSERGHAPTAAGAEHALEVQLPWLQRVIGEFELVPVVMGDQSYESSRALGVALAKLIHGDPETLIVASSDLSHYLTYDEATQMDLKTLRALEDWDYLSMSRNFEMRVWEACGGAPIVAAMIASERMGATQAKVLKYANSGDTTGDKSRVVGYGSAVFVKMAGTEAVEAPFTLSAKDKAYLLNLAQQSVEYAVKNGRKLDPPVPASEAMKQERGAFVTLTESGELRGCIGYTSAAMPLYLTVRDTAAYAALRDTRFTPVTVAELSRLEYEVSVLSPMRRVLDVQQIKVGKHGLLMKNGRYEGLLLPQVATEQGWDRHTLLEETCHKAGMNTNCWKDEDTDIFWFTALVFSRKELKAPDLDEMGPQHTIAPQGPPAPSSPPR